jgi:excisionase family DNA binding protein
MSKSSTEELTPQQAAAVLGLTVDYVRKLCNSGKLRCRKFGIVWIITRADLDRYQRTRRRPGRPRKH